MNEDRKKFEEQLYNTGYSEEHIRQANMQSDNIELEKLRVPLEKDYKYQSELLKKQLQMILDDERGDNDLDKKIKILETQNKILQAEKKFLADTLKEHGILTMK